MTAKALLERIREKKIHLSADGTHLRYKAPGGVLTPELRREIKDNKIELLEILSIHDAEVRLNKIGQLTLGEFEQGDCAARIRVPWLNDSPIWFAPTESEASVLMSEGVRRGRIWTVRELQDLMSIPGLDLEGIRSIQTLKDEFAGHLAEVRRIAPKGGRTR